MIVRKHYNYNEFLFYIIKVATIYHVIDDELQNIMTIFCCLETNHVTVNLIFKK